MTSNNELKTSDIISYGQLFRLIFVLFSLYLLGDALYRWDGFKYYATFSEFLPAAALISILWSMAAVLASFLIWLTLKAFKGICSFIRLNVSAEQLLSFFVFLGFFGSVTWAGKRFISRSGTSLELKLAILFSIISAAIFFTWLVRNNFARWAGIVHERITPLVWLFAIFVMLSIPFVTYHAWFKQKDVKVVKSIDQPTETDRDRPNILLVTFDALSTYDMSTYGYHRETSPFITQWAKSASLFSRFEAESNYTAPTTASMMTGKRVWTHRRQHPHGNPPLKSEIESLPLALRSNGYHTMAFIANVVASIEELGMNNAFAYAPPPTEFTSINSLLTAIDVTLDRMFHGKFKLYDWIIKEDFIFYEAILAIQPTFDQLRKRHSTNLAPEIAFNKFLTVLDENPPEPFFAWIHVYPPHDPYLPPAPYMGMYDPSSQLRTGTSQYKILQEWYRIDKNPHTFKFPEHIRPEKIDVFRARYNEFIRYCDKQFEDFMNELQKRNIFDNTLVIMSADHGDIFRPPFLTHGNSLYDPETHIPLIIKEPKQTEGKVIDDLVEQIDLPATILDLVNIAVPSWMEGRSAAPLLHDEKLPSRPAFAMGLQFTPSRPGEKISKADIAVWEGDYKLIYNLERKESSLFNLTLDPGEVNNLYQQEPERARRLLALINENLEKANERITKEPRSTQ